MESDDLLTAARAGTAARQVYRRGRLSEHLTGYLAVTGTLWLSWLVVALAAGSWSPWPLVPTVGWGLGLGFHAWRASRPRGLPDPGTGPPAAGFRGTPGRRPPTAAARGGSAVR